MSNNKKRRNNVIRFPTPVSTVPEMKPVNEETEQELQAQVQAIYDRVNEHGGPLTDDDFMVLTNHLTFRFINQLNSMMPLFNGRTGPHLELHWVRFTLAEDGEAMYSEWGVRPSKDTSNN